MEGNPSCRLIMTIKDVRSMINRARVSLLKASEAVRKCDFDRAEYYVREATNYLSFASEIIDKVLHAVYTVKKSYEAMIL